MGPYNKAVESATDKVRLGCLQFTPWGAALLRTLRERGMLVHRAALLFRLITTTHTSISRLLGVGGDEEDRSEYLGEDLTDDLGKIQVHK